MHQILWNNAGLPADRSLGRLLYQLRFDDRNRHQLFKPATKPYHFDGIHSCIDIHDVVACSYGAFRRNIVRTIQALNGHSNYIELRDCVISQPFYRHGIPHIGVWFKLSDGQTITALFYRRFGLLSWRWFLNKCDITRAIGSELSTEIHPSEIVVRALRLAEFNSRLFQKKQTAVQRPEISLLYSNKTSLDAANNSRNRQKAQVDAKEPVSANNNRVEIVYGDDFKAWLNEKSVQQYASRIRSKVYTVLSNPNHRDRKAIHSKAREVLGYQLFEAKLDVGPGFRMYFIQPGKNKYIVLDGSDKDKQRRIIDLIVTRAAAKYKKPQSHEKNFK